MAKSKYFNSKVGDRIRQISATPEFPTYQELAEQIGVSRDTFQKWICEDVEKRTMPETGAIIEICTLFGVSFDWLCGLSETKTLDPDVRIVAKTTKLSENATKKLMDKELYKVSEPLSAIIEHDKFYDMMNYLSMAWICSLHEEDDNKWHFDHDTLVLSNKLGCEFFIERATNTFRDIVSETTKGLGKNDY